MVNNRPGGVKSLSEKKDKQKGDVSGPVWGESKQWVKQEIPTEGEKGEEMDVEDQEIWFDHVDRMSKYRNDMRRVCHICSKAFSSGKALGGHMRIHVQRVDKRDLVFKKKLKAHRIIKFKKQNRKPNAFVEQKHHCKEETAATGCCGGSGKKTNKPTCTVCLKSFPSLKSLFGHMRCHPNRGWRGINPPSSKRKNSYSAAASSSSSSSLILSDRTCHPPESEDQIQHSASGEKNRAIDLTASLSGWTATAKRGRKAMAAASSSSELLNSEDDELRAVNYLMMLARGAVATQRQEFAESDVAESCCKDEILEMNQDLAQLRNEERGSCEVERAGVAGSGLVRGEFLNKVEVREWIDEHGQNYSSDQEIDSTRVRNGLKALIKNKKKTRKKVKLRDLELVKNASPVTTSRQKVVEMTISPVRQHDKHEGDTRDKPFPTDQAMGGHSSNHNKFEIVIHNSMGEDYGSLSNLTAQVQETKDRGESCTRLNPVEVGQHQYMACYSNFSTAQAKCRGNFLVGAPSSQGSSRSEASHMSQRAMDFDLNEMPPSEDKAAGFHYVLGLDE